jgi:hypothetical protein
LGLGNSSAKTDRGNQLAGINASWNVYNRGLPMADTSSIEGETKTNAGFGSLQAAQQYWQNLMGGSRPAVMQAAAPAVGAVVDQEAARRNEEATMGTGRTGGAVASNEQAKTREEADINNIIAGVQPEAAKQVGALGTAESNVGLAQMRDALAALGLSQDVADEIINSSIQSRPISISANAAVRQQWSNFLGTIFPAGSSSGSKGSGGSYTGLE